MRRRTGRGSGVGEEFGENWQAEKRSGGRGFVRVYEREVRVEEWGLFFFFLFYLVVDDFMLGKKKRKNHYRREREREREFDLAKNRQFCVNDFFKKVQFNIVCNFHLVIYILMFNKVF